MSMSMMRILLQPAIKNTVRVPAKRIHQTAPRRTDLVPDDLQKYLEEFGNEPHIAGKGKDLFIKVCLYIGVPVVSIIGFYNEYQHVVVHATRPRIIDDPQLFARFVKYPWKDGIHSPLHHPYYTMIDGHYDTDEVGPIVKFLRGLHEKYIGPLPPPDSDH